MKRLLLLLFTFATIGAQDSTYIEFEFTGSSQTFVVPEQIYNIKIETRGVDGSGEWDGLGGFDAIIIADFEVISGDFLYIVVGEVSVN